MLLALLTKLSPLGKSLLSHVCSLSCCCSNLQPDAQALHIALLQTNNVQEMHKPCTLHFFKQTMFSNAEIY